MIEIKRSQPSKLQASYRAAYDFHLRHNPPRVDTAYWRTHTPGIDDPPQAELDYWQEVAEDAARISEGNPFLSALVSAVIGELEREYNSARPQK